MRWLSAVFLLVELLRQARGESATSIDMEHRQISSRDMAAAVKKCIQQTGYPVRVTAMVCWKTGTNRNQYETLIFWSGLHILSLSDFAISFGHHFNRGINNHALAIRRIDSNRMPKTMHDEHHEMILIDLRCSEQELLQLFNKVRLQ